MHMHAFRLTMPTAPPPRTVTRPDLPRLPALADRLVWARRQVGLTQQQLVKLAGVSRDIIAKVESGVTTRPRDIEAIAAALALSAAWLQFGREEIERWSDDTLELAAAYDQLPSTLKNAIREIVGQYQPSPTPDPPDSKH